MTVMTVGNKLLSVAQSLVVLNSFTSFLDCCYQSADRSNPL